MELAQIKRKIGRNQNAIHSLANEAISLMFITIFISLLLISNLRFDESLTNERNEHCVATINIMARLRFAQIKASPRPRTSIASSSDPAERYASPHSLFERKTFILLIRNSIRSLPRTERNDEDLMDAIILVMTWLRLSLPFAADSHKHTHDQ